MTVIKLNRGPIEVDQGPIEVDRGLAEQTLQGLLLARQQLEKEREAINLQIEELAGQISEWQQKLGHNTNGKAGNAKTRRKKGQNLKDIVALFESLPQDSGLTMADIAERTEIPWSSCRNVMNKYREQFREDSDSLWYYIKKISTMDAERS